MELANEMRKVSERKSHLSTLKLKFQVPDTDVQGLLFVQQVFSVALVQSFLTSLGRKWIECKLIISCPMSKCGVLNEKSPK